MFGILLAIHVLVTVLLIFVVLVQKSEGGSSLFASGSGNGMFTARGTSDILTKSTWVLATIFLCNCILMAHISSKEIKEANSIVVDSELKKLSTKKQSTKVNESTEYKKQTKKLVTERDNSGKLSVSETKNPNTQNTKVEKK